MLTLFRTVANWQKTIFRCSQAEDVKCLLSDAMLSYSQNNPASLVSTPKTATPTTTPTPSTSGMSPLSQANTSLLSNSPGGSGDGATCNRSVAEAQGEQRDSVLGNIVYQAASTYSLHAIRKNEYLFTKTGQRFAFES